MRKRALELLVVLNGKPSRAPDEIVHMIVVTVSIQIDRSIERLTMMRIKRLHHQKRNRPVSLLAIFHHPYTNQAELILKLRENSPRLLRPYTPVIADAVSGKALDGFPSLIHSKNLTATIRPMIPHIKALAQPRRKTIKGIPPDRKYVAVTPAASFLVV